MATPVQFVGGDDIIETFLIETTEGEIADLSGCVITGEVSWRGKPRILLSQGDGINIIALHPERATDSSLQVQHGSFHIPKTRSGELPMGNIATVRVISVDAADIRSSSHLYRLERIP
jgi:hypothetical protein